MPDFEVKIHTCVICGKRFLVTDSNYVYKDFTQVSRHKTVLVYFCRYNHMREWERLVGPREKAQLRIRELRPKIISVKRNLPKLKAGSLAEKKANNTIREIETEIDGLKKTVEVIDRMVQDAIKKTSAKRLRT